MKYIPVKMRLEPSESMNNMGSLRVDILDAADLPSADRNGFSDPFCKFELNGESVHKTKVQKKTLHPAWNEFFEVSIPSRTGAKFNVRVMDWDFGDKADFLGEAGINLEMLEPMHSQEVTLVLNGEKGPGTAGVIRLRLLFKAAYVTRTRQGSSTFSGTIGPAGKIIGAPVKGVSKVGTTLGGGVVKGASFLRHGFKSKDRAASGDFGERPSTANSGVANGDAPIPSIEAPSGPQRSAPLTDGGQGPATPAPAHNRKSSFGGKSFTALGGGGSKTEGGVAEFSILSASGYPPNTKVQVTVKQVHGKSHKDVLKTKPIKLTGEEVHWENKSCRHNCSPDAQFQIQVKDHTLFGGDDLGDALFYIDDSQGGSEKTIAVGEGHVNVRTSFTHTDALSTKDSPHGGVRRSFLSKRDVSRGSTPA